MGIFLPSVEGSPPENSKILRGCPFYTLKVPSGMPYLSPWWTNLSNIFIGSIKRAKLNVYQISDKCVHQELIYGIFDGTYRV